MASGPGNAVQILHGPVPPNRINTQAGSSQLGGARSLTSEVLWYRRFRAAAYASAIGLIILSVLIVLPLRPFSYLPPIIVGGSAGEWLLLGYVLYGAVGFCGFAAVSSLLFVLESHEGRRVDGRVMGAALVLLFAGVTASCLLLVLAGALGGYDITIEGQTTQAAGKLLGAYVYPVTLTVLSAVVGTCLLVLGMSSAKAPRVE